MPTKKSKAAAADNAMPVAMPTAEITQNDPGLWTDADLSFLDPPVQAGPAFPVDVLPERTAALLVEFATVRRLSLDYVACAVIGAASAAIGNRARMLSFDGRLEPLTLFITLVGWPASGKGGAIAIARAPLTRIQDALLAAHVARAGNSSARLSTLAASFRSSVARRLSHEGVAEAEGNGTDEPPGLLLSEYSVAGLIDELQHAPEGRTLISDELTGPLSGASGQSGLKARAMLLEAFDGQPYRKRLATKGLILVPALQVSILGCTQPDRVTVLVGQARDGLVPRFLWCAPEVEPTAALPDGAGPIEAFEAALARLVRIEPAGDEEGYSRAIPLAAKARLPLETAAATWITSQMQAEPTIRDVLARARQQAMRLSVVLALLEHALAGREGVIDVVEAADVARGIALMDRYFLPMSERTFAMAGTPRETDTVRLARYLRRLGRAQVSLRDDLYRGVGSPVRTPAAVAEAVAELKARGLVREASRDPHARGRPGLLIEVHPGLIPLAP